MYLCSYKNKWFPKAVESNYLGQWLVPDVDMLNFKPELKIVKSIHANSF